jgi:hypothetical protein
MISWNNVVIIGLIFFRNALPTRNRDGNLRTDNKYMRYFVNKKFAIDAISMAVFWVIVYIPVFAFTSKSVEAALIGLGSSAILEIVFGGVYGKFNDWMRKKAGVTD